LAYRYNVGENQRFELMQYTGLLDRNGKEIYEGDILSSFTYPKIGKLIRIPKQKIVEFNVGGIWQGYQIDDTDEIIGNIYENPDLLTKE